MFLKLKSPQIVKGDLHKLYDNCIFLLFQLINKPLIEVS